MGPGSEKSVESLDPSLKALAILEACSGSGKEGLGVAEITRATGLSRSTVHRLVAALLETGYLRKLPGKKYSLGYRILSLAAPLLDDSELKEMVRPYLERLAQRTGETVHLVQRNGHYAVYVDKIDSPQPVGLLSKVGVRLLLHCTAAGKVLLAHMSEEERRQVYETVGLPAQTPATITSAEKLEEELRIIREQGYALDKMENRDGVFCIAGPVFNHQKAVVASFSVSGPAFRFDLERAAGWAGEIKETSLHISKMLGYRP
jgi:IclR family acetate operon transcriptional repressor